MAPFYTKNIVRECGKAIYITDIVNIIAALSILQNGPFPTFLSAETASALWDAQDPSPCIIKIREGLDMLGIYQV